MRTTKTTFRSLIGLGLAAALAWPEQLDLSKSRLMIDVGGGSGAHAIGAALRWPDLRAVVFEMSTVCEVAREVIGGYRLQDRIATQTGDLWNDPLPRSDLHFYGDIFHDWPDDKCRQLAAKSFDALERGHDVRRCTACDDGVGHAHMIQPVDGGYRAGTDPRAESLAMGF